MRELTNTEAELKEGFAYKKHVISDVFKIAKKY